MTPVVAGYDASNWLTFVRTFDRFPPAAFSADLGKPLVPVPLRAYPELPALVSQTAQSDDDPKTVDNALHWAYVFTYAHQSAAQDQIKIEIEFNRRPPNRAFQALKIDTLFGALAQYAAVSDTLWQILAGLQGPDANAGNTVLANTLDTYAGLAERVAKSVVGLVGRWQLRHRRRGRRPGATRPSRAGSPLAPGRVDALEPGAARDRVLRKMPRRTSSITIWPRSITASSTRSKFM